MKLGVLCTLFALPLAAWANESASVETPKVPAAPAIETPDSPAIDAPAVTESEFSGDPAIDSLDADAAAKLEKEKAANVDTEVAKADSSEAADSTSEEPEMSQEEADAELAAASVDTLADSTQSKNLLETLNLDMSTAIMPTESRRIAGPYGIRTYRMHRGVDLGLCHGEDRTIVAAFAGVVKLVRNQGRRRGYGKYVIIDHGNGLTTLYAHLAKWNVSIGDTLQAGDTIGVGGNTGRSFGAHLHFEMRYHGIYIDPTTVFDFEQGTFRDVVAVLDPQKLQATEDEYQKELSKHRYYKVRRGDCLGKIARKYGISITRLKQLNKIKGNMIRPGQVLRCS